MLFLGFGMPDALFLLGKCSFTMEIPRIVTAMSKVLTSLIWAVSFALSAFGEVDPAASGPYRNEGEFRLEKAWDGLTAPDGIALDVERGWTYVSEENASRIVLKDQENFRVIVDGSVPVYEAGRLVAGMRGPEGLAYDASRRALLVVEDIPGGRVLEFDLKDMNRIRGKVVALPGNWSRFAWEGVAVNTKGEILICGSDIESINGERGPDLPSGAVLFRDEEGDWWIPIQRLFASFSSVAFGPKERRAIYTCELTGEIGWFDLESRKSIGATASYTAKSPEGSCALPDGTFLVAEEGGAVVRVDPSLNRVSTVYKHEHSIESLVWDNVDQCVWVTDDGAGKLIQLVAPFGFSRTINAFDFATYYPLYSPQSVPVSCPEFLRGVLSLGGADFDRMDDQAGSFREFVERLPMLAASADVRPLNPDTVYEDPVSMIQFVVFAPNRILQSEAGISVSLAGFAAVRKSGSMVQTTRRKMDTQGGTLVLGRLEALGAGMMMVPQPAAVSVTPLGIASVTFLGFGETPDYSLVINPRNPSESYMVVFLQDGTREHYQLAFPEEEEDIRNWVIGYSQIGQDGWQRLSFNPALAISDEGLGGEF